MSVVLFNEMQTLLEPAVGRPFAPPQFLAVLAKSQIECPCCVLIIASWRESDAILEESLSVYGYFLFFERAVRLVNGLQHKENQV